MIVTPEGHVLTNHHVITGQQKINVTLHDGRVLPARVIGEDKFLDIAVLKIEASGLPMASAPCATHSCSAARLRAVINPVKRSMAEQPAQRPIAVFTGSRAEYGLLRHLIAAIAASSRL